jgi:hypothetical protein
MFVAIVVEMPSNPRRQIEIPAKRQRFCIGHQKEVQDSHQRTRSVHMPELVHLRIGLRSTMPGRREDVPDLFNHAPRIVSLTALAVGGAAQVVGSGAPSRLSRATDFVLGTANPAPTSAAAGRSGNTRAGRVPLSGGGGMGRPAAWL